MAKTIEEYIYSYLRHIFSTEKLRYLSYFPLCLDGVWTKYAFLEKNKIQSRFSSYYQGAQLLSGRALDLRPKGRGFEPHRCHCVVSLSKNINPSLVLVQPRKTCPFITERLLMGRKESNQTNKSSYYHDKELKNICTKSKHNNFILIF